VKIVKAFSLAISVVGLAMALLGSSTAMAESTALCEADESPCNSPVSHVHYVASNLEVLTSAMDYKCDALLLASVGKLGAPQVLEGNFTYTNCNNSCTRTEENGPAVLTFLRTGTESAEATGESLVHVECGFTINCRYTLEGLVGNVKGPLISSENNGEITFEKQELTHESGTLCPTVGYLDAKFVPLSPIYISS
jgi:hypothetical protein